MFQSIQKRKRQIVCPCLFVVTAFGWMSLPQLKADDSAPVVVFMVGEKEYKTNETLPRFAKDYLAPAKIKSKFVHADMKNKHLFAGMEALEKADLLFVSVRRRGVPTSQMQHIRKHLKAGKPIVGIRTANHAFAPKEKLDAGYERWDKFDPEVLGGSYHGHHNNKLTCQVHLAATGKMHPILKGLDPDSWISKGSLYEVSPINEDARVLLTGTVPNQPSEPIAWSRRYNGGRVFYTSLGHYKDFENAEFNQMLLNAVQWALSKE